MSVVVYCLKNSSLDPFGNVIEYVTKIMCGPNENDGTRPIYFENANILFNDAPAQSPIENKSITSLKIIGLSKDTPDDQKTNPEFENKISSVILDTDVFSYTSIKNVEFENILSLTVGISAFSCCESLETASFKDISTFMEELNKLMREK